MDVALVAVVGTLAIIGAVFLGFGALVMWQRRRGRPADHGRLSQQWRHEHGAGKPGGDQ